MNQDQATVHFLHAEDDVDVVERVHVFAIDFAVDPADKMGHHWIPSFAALKEIYSAL
jgi:hypothetical protein